MEANSTMDNTEIGNKINAFLADEFEVDESIIQPEANMRETLDLDSLDYVDLVVVIEETFGFKPNQEDFAKINTFQDFYNYVAIKVS